MEGPGMVAVIMRKDLGEQVSGSRHVLSVPEAHDLVMRGWARLENPPANHGPVPVDPAVEVLGGLPKGYPVLRSLDRQSRPSGVMGEDGLLNPRAGKYHTRGKRGK